MHPGLSQESRNYLLTYHRVLFLLSGHPSITDLLQEGFLQANLAKDEETENQNNLQHKNPELKRKKKKKAKPDQKPK